MFFVDLVADFISDVVKSIETCFHVIWQLFNGSNVPSTYEVLIDQLIIKYVRI